MIVTDSSRLKDWHDCNRLRYLGYEADGIGYTPISPNEDIQYGLAVHKGGELITRKYPFQAAYREAETYLDVIGDENITADGYPRRTELKALLYATLRIFEELWLPNFLEHYEVLTSEVELTIRLAEDILYATRLDDLVKGLRNGAVFNLNMKTSTRPERVYKDNLFNLQLLMEAECARENWGWVGGTILLGIAKGNKQVPSQKEQEEEGKTGYRRNSPLIYAWTRYNSTPGEAQEYRPEYTPKWKRVATWIEPGAKEWVDFLLKKHPSLCMNQFVQTPEINHDPKKIAAVKRQIIAIERHIRRGRVALERNGPEMQEIILDAYWPQNFNNCNNNGGYQHPCPFVDVCHRGLSHRNKNSFKPRVPNHPVEGAVWQT